MSTEHLTVGRSTTVHVAYGTLPRCDTGTGARGGSSRKTELPVTCKRCLRIVPTANDTEN
jgi:hypothetical protein